MTDTLQTTKVDTGSIAYSGVDWCTLVLPRELEQTVAGTLSYLVKVMRNLKYVSRSQKISYASGVRIGKLFYGTLNGQEERSVISVSGASSQILAIWGDLRAKTTRLDIAVDFISKRPNKAIKINLNQYYDDIYKYNPRKLSVMRMENVAGGSTLYVGKGGKGMKLRAYDKGAKEDGIPNYWYRYELQIGREYASRARDALVNSSDVTKWMKGVVLSYCEKKGVPLPSMHGIEYTWIASSTIEMMSDDEEKALLFMRSVVKPFIRRLRRYASDDWIIAELGLPSLAEPATDDTWQVVDDI